MSADLTKWPRPGPNVELSVAKAPVASQGRSARPWLLVCGVGVLVAAVWFGARYREGWRVVRIDPQAHPPAQQAVRREPAKSMSVIEAKSTGSPSSAATGVRTAAMRIPLMLRGGGPAADRDWPRSVAISGTPKVDVVDEDALSKRFVYRSPHFEFESEVRLGTAVVREFARVFEATYLLNCRLPLDWRPAPELFRERFATRLLATKSSYLAAGALPGSAGTYSRNLKTILVPLSSLGVTILDGDRTVLDRGGEANATLIHEITHQMMNAWLPRLPRWLGEGAAEYVSIAEYLHGRFYLNQMRDRMRRYVTRHTWPQASYPMLKTSELMALDADAWNRALMAGRDAAGRNYVSAALLTYYFYHLDGSRDGAGMIRYLREIEAGTPERAASRHLLRDRLASQLDQEVIHALKAHGLPIDVTTLRNGR